MIDDRVREIAAACGAELAATPQASDLAGFELFADGRLRLIFGDRVTTLPRDGDGLPAEWRGEVRSIHAEMLRHVAMLTPGGSIRTGVTYARRAVLDEDGRPSAIFAEVGR